MLRCIWQVLRNGLVLTNPDPSASAHNCATDADTDVAYALLLAGAPRQVAVAGRACGERLITAAFGA